MASTGGAESLNASGSIHTDSYGRLKALAGRLRRRGGTPRTLCTTELLHEAYLRMDEANFRFQQTAQFFAYAARAMRHVLTDAARRRAQPKRGGDQARVILSDLAADSMGVDSMHVDSVHIDSLHTDLERALELDEALSALERDDLRAARVVELHYFAGLDLDQVGEASGIARRTVDRDWRYARIPRRTRSGLNVGWALAHRPLFGEKEKRWAEAHPTLPIARLTGRWRIATRFGVLAVMPVIPLRPRHTLRELFDDIIELAPEERDAKIAALALPRALATRLRAMLAFDELTVLAPDLRSARLLGLADDVRPQVEAMLAADTRPPLLLKAAAVEVIERMGVHDEEPLGQSMVGSSIGNFRLLELIGHGGSSVVFRATRDAGDGAQVVALKLLRTGLFSADAQRRFRREQAILAQLTHRNIAKLIEGGVSSAGIPYIAMELVDGVPITQAADAQGLNLEQRLAWFANLCRAIQAAHAALIVHRDLKPSNLLVTGDGELKVVDFGIAKLIDDDEPSTRTWSIALTPEYAAPEQFSSAPVTTAVDVYALGVVLGELLTGRRPTGAIRASSALSGAADFQLPRGLPARDVLQRRLRGDLDAILACALADESARRYPSAGAFADDVERYLAGKPVRAHPPSRAYRVRKFVRRHRSAVALTATLVVAVLGSLGVVAWQGQSIAREAQRAQSTRDFLLRVFSAAEPAGPRLAPPTVADVVRASIGEAQHSASLQPSVRIELIDALGGVLRKQGDLKGSLRLLEENYANAVATLGASAPATLSAGLGLAQARAESGQHASARPLLDDLLRLSVSGADVPLQARLLSASADLGTELFERTRALSESAHAVQLCERDCEQRTRILTLVTRGYVLSNFQDEAGAIPVLEQAVAEQRRMFAGPHVEIADTLDALSRAQRRAGHADRAEALAREALAIVETSLPDPHQRRSDALDTLRQVLIDLRRYDEAIELGQRIVAMDEVARGPDNTKVGTDQNTLGFTYMLRGDYAIAGEHFRAALAIADAIADNQRRSGIYQANLGYSIGLGGDATKGMRLVQAALERFHAQPEIDYSEVASALEKLGDLQRRSAELDAAVATYARSDRIYREQLSTAPAEWHARTLIGLGRTLAERHRDEAAAELALRNGLARLETRTSVISMLRVEARAALAELLGRGGRTSDAVRLLDEANAEASAARGTLPPDLRVLLQRSAASIKPHRV